MLDFAACMREHGVDMPDPQFDATTAAGVIGARWARPASDPTTSQMRGGPGGVPAASWRTVAATFDAHRPEEQAEMQEQVLAFAQCMRDHGIDMPDPEFDDRRRGRRS